MLPKGWEELRRAARFLARCVPPAERDVRLTELERRQTVDGDRTRAVQRLREAVTRGYRNAADLEADEALAALRSSPEVRPLLVEMRKGAGGGRLRPPLRAGPTEDSGAAAGGPVVRCRVGLSGKERPMPVHDHFTRSLSMTHPWRGFHSAWANTITRRLNGGLLPECYWAIPNVDLGGSVEIDVATVEHQGQTATGPPAGVATWAPPSPTITLPVDFTHVETIEVQVFADEGGPRLRGAVELVSPANKDRPSNRRAFAVKCASYLQQEAGVVVVDVVTDRCANLHEEIMRALELGNGAPWQSPTRLYAVAYRTANVEGQPRFQAWAEALALGAPLPCLPLWLGPELSVPIDLEAAYTETCTNLRLRM